MANRLMIAKTHLAMGNKDQARHWLQEALKLPVRCAACCRCVCATACDHCVPCFHS